MIFPLVFNTKNWILCHFIRCQMNQLLSADEQNIKLTPKPPRLYFERLLPPRQCQTWSRPPPPTYACLKVFKFDIWKRLEAKDYRKIDFWLTHMKQSSCEVMVISMSSSSSSSSSTDSSSRSFSSFVWLSLSLLGDTVFRLELIVVIWTLYH